MQERDERVCIRLLHVLQAAIGEQDDVRIVFAEQRIQRGSLRDILFHELDACVLQRALDAADGRLCFREVADYGDSGIACYIVIQLFDDALSVFVPSEN